MAGTKRTGRDALPKRFQPLFDQANTETAIRYGAQESALGSILEQLTRDAGRQAQAQQTAGQTVLGAYKGASQNLTKAYSDAGLTPQVLQGIANSPTGQRLAGELASGQAGIQQGLLGVQAGQQYLQQHISDQYRDDAGQVAQQLSALGKERGLYQSSLLDQLITGDRSARHDANVAARKQAHDDQQAILDRAATMGNALIGQGITPQIDADGNVTLGPPIPGGKADPNAPGNKPKRTTGPGTASADAQRSAGLDFKKALGFAAGLRDAAGGAPDKRADAEAILTNGSPAKKGKVIYEDVTVTDAYGTKKTKRRAKIDPKTGEQVTSRDRPATPAFDAPIAAAATEQAFFGYVTTKTVRELQKLGYSVNQIPGLKTENQARASRPRRSAGTKNSPNGRYGAAGRGADTIG